MNDDLMYDADDIDMLDYVDTDEDDLDVFYDDDYLDEDDYLDDDPLEDDYLDMDDLDDDDIDDIEVMDGEEDADGRRSRKRRRRRRRRRAAARRRARKNRIKALKAQLRRKQMSKRPRKMPKVAPQVKRGFKKAESAVLKTQAKQDMLLSKINSNKKRITGNEYAQAISKVVDEVQNNFKQEIDKNQLVKSGLPLLPLLFLKPAKGGKTLLDPRVVSTLGVAAAAAMKYFQDDSKGKKIEVNGDNVTIPISGSYAFHPVLLDNKNNEITDTDWDFRSSDPNIAEVNGDGVLTAKNAGAVAVVVTEKKSGVTSRVRLNITADTGLKVEVNESDQAIPAGGTYRFIPTLTDARGNEIDDTDWAYTLSSTDLGNMNGDVLQIEAGASGPLSVKIQDKKTGMAKRVYLTIGG